MAIPLSLVSFQVASHVTDINNMHSGFVADVEGKHKHLCVFGGGKAGVDAVPDGNLYLYDIEDQVWSIVKVQSDIPPTTQGHVLTAFGSNVG